MATTVPTITDLKTSFEIDSSIKDPRLTFCLNNAIRKVKKNVGTVLFAEVFPDPQGSLEEEDQIRHDDFCTAIINYSIINLLTNANLRIRASGQVKKEIVNYSEMSTGNVTHEYLTPSEVREWKSTLSGEADGLISTYLPDSGPGFSTTRILRA